MHKDRVQIFDWVEELRTHVTNATVEVERSLANQTGGGPVYPAAFVSN